MKNIFQSLRVLFFFTVICGVVYPLFIEGTSKWVFPKQANGSLIIEQGRIVGSEWIGQKMTSNVFVHSRPSAVEYDAKSSGASNYSVTSKILFEPKLV